MEQHIYQKDSFLNTFRSAEKTVTAPRCHLTPQTNGFQVCMTAGRTFHHWCVSLGFTTEESVSAVQVQTRFLQFYIKTLVQIPDGDAGQMRGEEGRQKLLLRKWKDGLKSPWRQCWAAQRPLCGAANRKHRSLWPWPGPLNPPRFAPPHSLRVLETLEVRKAPSAPSPLSLIASVSREDFSFPSASSHFYKGMEVEILPTIPAKISFSQEFSLRRVYCSIPFVNNYGWFPAVGFLGKKRSKLEFLRLLTWQR